MPYYFYLADLKLPITPSSLNIKTGSKNTTVTLINDGEINILKKPSLRDISFEFLLPHQKYPFSNHHDVKQHYATTIIPLIQALKEDGRAFLFKVIRLGSRGESLFHTCILSHIEDFEFDEDVESLGLDVKCKITLKEWKPYSTKIAKINIKTKVVSAVTGVKDKITGTIDNTIDSVNKKLDFFMLPTIPTRATKEAEFKKVTVLGNESVFSLVKNHYGDTNNGEMDMVLAANSMSHPMDIKVGQELVLPAKTTSNKTTMINSTNDLSNYQSVGEL